MSKAKKFAVIGIVSFLAGVVIISYLPGRIIDGLEAQYVSAGRDIPIHLGLGLPLGAFVLGVLMIVLALVMFVRSYRHGHSTAEKAVVSNT